MPHPIIDYAKCKTHKVCVEVCPMEVFEEKDGKVVVAKPDECIGCKACEVQCPESAIVVEDQIFIKNSILLFQADGCFYFILGIFYQFWVLVSCFSKVYILFYLTKNYERNYQCADSGHCPGYH